MYIYIYICMYIYIYFHRWRHALKISKDTNDISVRWPVLQHFSPLLFEEKGISKLMITRMFVCVCVCVCVYFCEVLVICV